MKDKTSQFTMAVVDATQLLKAHINLERSLGNLSNNTTEEDVQDLLKWFIAVVGACYLFRLFENTEFIMRKND